MNAVTGKAPNAEKGKRYLAVLDQALCDAAWADIPEHARKVEKHAPERSALTLAARSEAQIASASHRPTSASSTGTTSIHGLGEVIPKLAAALENPKISSEDAYAVKTCLAEIHWLQEDPSAALSALPESISSSGDSIGQTGTLGWLEVCNVKVSFIRAAALQALGRDAATKQQLLQAARQTPGTRTPELRKWTERLLARACTYDYNKSSELSKSALSESLQCFRAWASFWQRATPKTAATSTLVDIPRRRIWKSYYQLLSIILERGLVLGSSPLLGSNLVSEPDGELSEGDRVSVRLHQRQEFKQIESTYESLLLNETHFPKSSNTNIEVEEWIEQATINWKLFVGVGWTDAELGPGGKEGVSRGMLDILYRAATKTFHSTAILRQLFHVHTAIGEFDLAIHAFKSYEEIVGKGKTRAAKTGKHELGFDDDDIALKTAAEAVRVLCRFGDRVQGEMAIEVAQTISDWLAQQKPTLPKETENSDDDRTQAPQNGPASTETSLQSTSLAAAHSAIGTSRAHWACLTYEPATRSQLQADAIEHLRRAQAYDSGSEATAYALARVLAETRNIPAAIEVVKHSIAAASDDDDNDEAGKNDSLAQKRRLIPLWHLLALCLTARDEYEAAGKMCAMAFDQFEDSDTLFGPIPWGSRDAEKSGLTDSPGSLIDHMDSFEKESLVQVKLTQLALIELVEGPGFAVDMTGELLSLYSRLFGSPEPLKLVRNPPPTAASAAPSKAGGTLRSLAGSIKAKSGRLGGAKDQSEAPPLPKADAIASNDASGREQNMPPIAITVTNEDGVASGKHHGQHHHHLHLPFRHHGHNDVIASKPSGDQHEKAPSAAIGDLDSLVSSQKNTSNINDVATGAEQALGNGLPGKARQPLAEIPHNAPSDAWPPPTGHDDQPPEQDVRLPAPHPSTAAMLETRLASLHEKQHKACVLVKIWLFIAGLYIRADLYDDASGAIGEAVKLVEASEIDLGAARSSAKTLFMKGWGGAKSIDELWADVWSTKGGLASARELPFEAMAHYEQALSYFPDHPQAIIGISDLLMDIFEQKLAPEEPRQFVASSTVAAPGQGPSGLNAPRPTIASSTIANGRKSSRTSSEDPDPAELNRLAARDRAYMLLSNLTRLGTGWDNPEAWYTLARSHELSEQVSKAKQALWWVVELEDCRPIRDWKEIGPGGYTL